MNEVDFNDPQVASLALQIAREVQDHGVSETYQSLLNLDYQREPVDPETFLFDPYYMGRLGRSLYSKWIDVLLEVLDPLNGYHELIFTGSIGSGKTTCAALAMAYKLYLLSCLKNPPVFYGLMEGTPILFGVYNLFKYKADDNYGVLKAFVEQSQYFKDHFPTLKMKNKSAKDGLFFDNGVYVISGSTELHALGLNLFSLILDEVNFMRVPNSPVGASLSQAQKLYTASKRRLESRYMYKGVVPGLMILISSRNVETSWLEKHIAESRGKKGVFIADYAIWEVKKDVMGYSGKTFRVEVGDTVTGSRILDGTDKPRLGAEVVNVPVEHKEEFEKDIEGALRDLAGRATAAHSLLVRHREHVGACVNSILKHPFKRETITISDKDGVRIQSYVDWRKLVDIRMSIIRPKLNPGAPRHIHIDLAEKHDCCGFAMGHVHNREVKDPAIALDMMLRITPPKMGSIDFSKIRDFVVYLRDTLGYSIGSISLDSYQSSDMRQILEKLGFHTDLVSVDRTDEPYRIARSLFYEHRVLMYYYRPFVEEFTALVHDAQKKKVDHPQDGCFLGSTKVSLLDGTERTFEELCAMEEPFWVYSYDVDKKRIVPALAHSPRKTREMVRLLQVTLDNGEKVKCTPDHLWMLRDGTYRRADQLKPGDSLMPLYRKTSEKGLIGYEMIMDPELGWRYTHIMVCDETQGKRGRGFVRHHANFNCRDNNPFNLQWLSRRAHNTLHNLAGQKPGSRKKRSESTKRNWGIPVFKSYMIECIKSGMGSMSEEDKNGMLNNIKRARNKPETNKKIVLSLKRLWQNEGFRQKMMVLLDRINSNPETGKKISKALQLKYQDPLALAHMLRCREEHPEIEEKRRESCRKVVKSGKLMEGKVRKVVQMMKEMGLDPMTQWEEGRRKLLESGHLTANVPLFKTALKYLNHSVLFVEEGGRGDVYDITVEKYHNFALSVGTFVHNSKDVSDAVAGVLYYLSRSLGKTKESKTQRPADRLVPLLGMELDNIR